MIASQKIGKSFSGALRYNMKKLLDSDPHSRAELLDTNFSSLTASEIIREVDWIRQLRPALSKYVYHTSLNFSKEEAGLLDNEKLLDIAHDYLKGMGFTNNQYLIFRHHDADHPHMHVLANRISFDGQVVSDSNNYKRSEALLRRLEKQYHFTPVHQSRFTALNMAPGKVQIYATGRTFDRAPIKDEIEMAVRTGSGSSKMRLQALLSGILGGSGKLPIEAFIAMCEKQSIHLLFNQASTGRISGITYFYGDFKARGQALGSKYKWAEILKHLDYEQDRDGKAISQTNARTKAAYGELRPDGTDNIATGEHHRGGLAAAGADTSAYADQFEAEQRAGSRTHSASEEAGGTYHQAGKGQVADDATGRSANDLDSIPGIYITDDEDDELAKRKRRRGR